MTHKESADRRIQIVECAKRGESARDIADKFGVTIGLVYHATVGIAAVSSTPRRFSSSGRTYQIIALLCNTELSLAEIGDQMHVTKQYVSEIYHECQKHGIVCPVRVPGKPGRPPKDKS